MTEYRKKLIEVALPLEAINKASAKEKSIRHGHPSTLHLWWARRPLAACRAVLFASMVDDPDSDPMFAGDEDIAASKRAERFNLIEELVLWENSNNLRVLNRARGEIVRCVATQKIEEGAFKRDDVLVIKSHLPAAEGKGAKPSLTNDCSVGVEWFRKSPGITNWLWDTMHVVAGGDRNSKLERIGRHGRLEWPNNAAAETQYIETNPL